MNYQKNVMFSLAIILMGAALYYVVPNRATLFNSSLKNGSVQDEKTTLQTQSVTIGIVIYKVTPKTITPNSETWDFEISLDTHTGSLDQDLASEIRIVDSAGNKYKALEWEGDPPEGHHREGTLKFSPITPLPASIELEIQTTTNSNNNILRWNI